MSRGHYTTLVWLAAGSVFLLPGSRVAAADSYDMDSLASAKSDHPENAEAIEAGREVFMKYCAGCHGDEGKGDGGSAPYLDPRPRDFSKGLFKFRSTQSGELPTDEDLYRTISRGVPGTAMPAWGEGDRRLTASQRWNVVYFAKTLGGDFGDADFDPYKFVLPYPDAPGGGNDRVTAGEAIFTDEKGGGCIKCHGANGRGNGSEAGTQKDDWGDMILPADMTKGWRYKNGTSVREIYRTLSTGMTGTPMPGYGETLSDDDRWSLAYFVESRIESHSLTGKRVLVAVRSDTIPDDPTAVAWQEVSPLDVPLLGQIVRAPRHANHAVDLVTVRAMYNDDEIAFHLTWNDRTESRKHEQLAAGEITDTYLTARALWERRRKPLRDSLQLQFPTKARDDGSMPFFYLGGGAGRVSLWRWFADGERFEERLQNGASQAPETRASEEQSLVGKSHFDDGRWMLVVKRKHPQGRERDVSFSPGSFVPFAMQVWDGGHGEAGPVCSIATWYWVLLETPVPAGAYIGAGVGFIGMEIIVLLLVMLARRRCASHEETA